MPTKIAVVTGASGGLGSELCKQIASQNVGLVLVDRNLQKSQAFAATLNGLRPGSALECFSVDLASHGDIRRMASALLDRYPRIDYLFNNAGVLPDTLQFSGHGNEMDFEVNALAPLQLIDLLRPALRAAGGATVVSTSAGLAGRVKRLDWDDLVRPQAFSKLFGPYAKSKQALNVLTAALAPEMTADGITVRTADPGPNKTGLTKGAGTPLWMRLFAGLLPTPDKGARKLCDAGFSPRWGRQTGIFLSNGKVQRLPQALADPAFQVAFLRRCRERAALL